MLGLLAAIMGALFALGAAGPAWPRVARRAMPALAGAAALADAAYLLAGAAPAQLDLPIGLPGSGLLLALDGLSGWFLLLLCLAAAGVGAAMLDEPAPSRIADAALPPFVGAMALSLLAGDGFGLALGIATTALAAVALVLARHPTIGGRAAASLTLGTATFGIACLVAALGLLARAEAWGIDLDFTAIRAGPPEGVRAIAVLGLTLPGAGAVAALAPLHLWLSPAQQAAPAPAGALIAGGMTKLGLYILVRVLFDLCGPAQPGWWGVPLIVLGAAGAVLGMLRAAMEPDLKAVLAGATAGSGGLFALGLGVALAARGADLPAVASLGAAAALLLAAGFSIVETLLMLAAGAVERGAGTRRLDRLGGLIHGMPVTTACVLAGAAALAALPPSAGFAGAWLLLQAVMAAPRIGGLAFQLLVALAACAVALAIALGAAASVRLVGVAFLGRPRTPRAAAAQEAALPTRAAMMALAGLAVLIGLFPGAVLRLAGPALRLLVPGASAGMADRAGVLTLAAQSDAPGYAAPALALLAGLALALVWAVSRQGGVAGHRTAPAWDGGFAPPPPWLPFGDPATEMNGSGFAQPLRDTIGAALLGARPPASTAAPHALGIRDPAARFLLRPAMRVRRTLGAFAERLHGLDARGSLALGLLVLALALAAVAAWGQV